MTIRKLAALRKLSASVSARSAAEVRSWLRRISRCINLRMPNRRRVRSRVSAINTTQDSRPALAGPAQEILGMERALHPAQPRARAR